jgi:GT2 family glycosyltransferase
MHKIYILLPTHNRSVVTEHFIDCLAAQTFANFHLVLIDDGSTDNTVQMAQAKIKNISVLKGRGNWWWAGSLQQGISWLEQHAVNDQDIVLFANDDTTFAANFLQKSVSILDGLESTLLLPFLCDENTGVPQESGIEADLQKLTFNPSPTPDKTNCLSTRGLLMRMSDLRRIGGFYPRLLPHYLSDYEFTIRAHKKGLRLITSADIAIQLDRKQTGYRNMDNHGFFDFIRRYFSKRNVSNPIYWSTFILMTVPKSHITGHLFRLWKTTVKTVFIQFVSSLREHVRKCCM